MLGRFLEYLQEVLALPAMVLEAPTFGYTEGLASTIFTFSEGATSINVNCFLDAILDPGGSLRDSINIYIQSKKF